MFDTSIIKNSERPIQKALVKMGVKGLWKILEPVGKPVTLESLQGKVLAVDLSIWIHQAIRGCAGRANEKNAHLIVLFHRVLKLLFYGVRPIFVFDGPNVPQFKKHILSKRRMKQDEASQKISKIQKKILKYLAAEAISDQKSQRKNVDIKISPEKNEILDDFCLGSSETVQNLADADQDSSSDEEDFGDIQVPPNLDMESDQFQSFPAKIQYDILLNLRENARFIRRKVQLPADSDDFSKYQLKNLLKKGRINQKLEQVEKNLAACDPALSVFGEFKVKNVYHGDRRRHILLETVAPPSNQNAVETELCSNLVENNPADDCNDPIPADQGPLDQDVFAEDSSGCEDSSWSLSQKSETKNLSENLESGEVLESEDKFSKIDRIERKTDPIATEFDQKFVRVAGESEFFKNDQFNKDSEQLLCTSSSSAVQIEIRTKEQSSQILSHSDDDDSFVEVEEIPVEFVENGETDGKFSRPESPEDPFDVQSGSLQNLKEEKSLPEESFEELLTQRRKAESVEKTLNSQILEECEALLKLFGVPTVRAPGEAEAQCAAIEGQGLTSGTITDDSDVWLFGGKTVYRHFFDKRQFVKKYDSTSIERFLGLTRQKLIQLALLVGCDYTQGVTNVGVVSAFEILSEFSSYDVNGGIEILAKFKSWWEERRTVQKPPGNQVRGRLANLDCHFPASFPDSQVFKAFVNPNVDIISTKNSSSFEWSSPDVDGLRRFAVTTFGWSREKIDDLILPPIRRFVESLTSRQTSIRNFAFSLRPEVDNSQFLQTKRVRKAIRRLTAQPTEIVQDEIPAKKFRKDTKNGRKTVRKAPKIIPELPKVGRKSKRLASKKQPVVHIKDISDSD